VYIYDKKNDSLWRSSLAQVWFFLRGLIAFYFTYSVIRHVDNGSVLLSRSCTGSFFVPLGFSPYFLPLVGGILRFLASCSPHYRCNLKVEIMFSPFDTLFGSEKFPV